MNKKFRQYTVDQIVDDIKEKLVGLTYKPGENLDLDELSRSYNTTPECVTEALNRLSQAGFLLTTKDGARVITWDSKDVEEIQELSLAMDRLVLEDIFALEDRSVLLKELGIISDRFVKADTPSDYARWAEQFSKALYRFAGSQRLLQMASSIKAQQAMLRNMILRTNQQDQQEEHKQLVAGIEEGDYTRTLQALESAYDRKTKAILELI